jgi:three-Cys-motif partner protein
MPIDANGRGFGKTTIDKQSGLEGVLLQQLSIIRAIMKKHPEWDICYRYIDCCAGKGTNPEVCCEGSPAIFLRTIEKFNIPYTAHFIDENKETCSYLEDYLSSIQTPHGKYKVVHGDYAIKLFEVLNTFYKTKKYRILQYGLIYVDPTKIPMWDVISQASNHTMARYIDILIHCSATGLKRKAYAEPGEVRKFLDDYILSIDKKKGFVRDLLDGDAQQMTFVFGTNNEKYDMSPSRFYNIDSRKGSEVLLKLSVNSEDFMNNILSKGTLEGWGCK